MSEAMMLFSVVEGCAFGWLMAKAWDALDLTGRARLDAAVVRALKSGAK